MDKISRKNHGTMISNIREKRKKLSSACKQLKTHFIGIDHVINRLEKDLETWYCCPELLTRPVVICLFGPTGTGKTDLVRRLVKLLGFHDRFCEVELMNKGSTQFHSSISAVLGDNQNIDSGKPAIVLLDEIQNFRTLNEDGRELPEYKFRDIWMLLSDGKLPFHVDLEYIMQLLWEYSDKTESLKPENKSKIKEAKIKDLIRFTQSIKKRSVEPLTKDPKMDVNEEEDDDEDNENVELRQSDIIKLERDAGVINRHDYYSLTHFKSILRLEESLEEIAKWDAFKKKAVIMERLSSPSLYEQVDYTKCLIFISGNIDEAYRFTKNTDEVDVDADIFHKKSLKINILNIKKALMTRFRPEQIARFGNMQIIYPTLSKKSYETIIQRKIKEIVKRVKNQFNLFIEVDKSINTLIYNNGVFPTQGTRPLFTTITEILEGCLPQFLLKALALAENKVKISYENSEICAAIGSEVVRVPYTGSLDKLRSDKNNNLNERAVNAVHEAGHAVVYASLLKLSPPQISALPASSDIGGFIWIHSISGSKSQLENRICISMSGSAAEKIVFGDGGATWGLQEDIVEATNLAGSMVKKYGMDKFSSYRICPQKSDIPNTDLDSANPIIEAIMDRANERAKQIIEENVSLFKDIVDHLMVNEQLGATTFKKMCAKNGIRISVKDSEETIYTDFSDMYKNFKNKS